MGVMTRWSARPTGTTICGRCYRHAVSGPDIVRETFVDPVKDKLRDPGWIPGYIATHLG